MSIYTDILAKAEKDPKKTDPSAQRILHLRAARIYDIELADASRAEESYLKALAIDPKDADALEALDRIYGAAGMHAELAEILKRRVAIAGSTEEQNELHARLGRIEADILGDLDAAVGSYEKILAEDSRNRPALEALERIYFKRGQWRELYEDVYEKLIDVARTDAEMADVYARMARIASEALSDDDRAADLWARVIDLRGEDPIALGALADLYESGQKWRELVDILERQVRVQSDTREQVAIHKRLGHVWAEKLGRDRNALEAWLAAYAIDDDDLEILRALAHLYQATQSWEELSTTLRRLVVVGSQTGALDEAETIELYGRLGELEGEVLGRTNEAVEAWQRVLALEPGDYRALSALEGLFTREGRWEETIDVLERRAAVQDDLHSTNETLLQAAAIWEERVGNRGQAAREYERVRALDPGNGTVAAQLEQIYRAEKNWERLTEILLEHVEHSTDTIDRIGTLQTVAQIYEVEMKDPEKAYYVLQHAFQEDFSNESTSRELERLATSAHKWQELLSEYSRTVSNLEHSDPQKAADLWVKIARWYGDHLNHLEYAIHSAQAALRLNPRHLGALAALADFHRKRGKFGELIAVLGQHAELEPEPGKRVDLYLSLADLLETQLQDPLQAIEAYVAALEIDPSCAEAVTALDRLYRRHEKWEQLIRVLDKKAAATLDVDEQIRIRMEIARLWDDRLGEPQKAIAAYDLVRELDPRILPALRALEKLYEKTGQWESHLDILEQELEAVTSDSEKVVLLGRIAGAWEERFGKLDRAAEALEKILTIDERNLGAFREVERVYRQERQWEHLVDAYRRHILAAGDSAQRMDLYCAMGQVFEDQLSDADRAIEAYKDVLTFDAEEPRALEALGRLYEKIDEWEQAAETMQRLVGSTGDAGLRVELHHRIGVIAGERLNDLAGAESHFLQALSLDQAHVPTLMSLTELYKQRGDWLKAAQMMARAEEQIQHPLEKIKLLFEAATIFDKRLHDQQRAMEYYSAAIALDPEHVDAGEPLAEIYFREKRWAELEPILDMLARKSAQVKKDNSNT